MCFVVCVQLTQLENWNILDENYYCAQASVLQMLIQMHMGTVVVLSSFQQFPDVSKECCSKLWSLGVHLHELKISDIHCFCKALLRVFTVNMKYCQEDSMFQKKKKDVSKNWELYSLPCSYPMTCEKNTTV